MCYAYCPRNKYIHNLEITSSNLWVLQLKEMEEMSQDRVVSLGMP